MKKRILAIGNSTMDLVMNISRMPAAGEVLYENGNCETQPGGSITLPAVAASKLGADVLLCTGVGSDEYGRELLSYYKKCGIDTRFIAQSSLEKTGFSVTSVEENGIRRTSVFPGASLSVTADYIETAFTSYPDAVYINFDSPDESIMAAAKFSREQKVPSFLDLTTYKKDFDFTEMGAVDILVTDAKCAFAYTGVLPSGTQSSLKCVSALAEKIKAKAYIIKKGIGGAFVFKGNFTYVVSDVEDADEKLEVLFTPALIMEYLKSGKSVRASKYASTVIARANKKSGDLISRIPTETEVLKYILEYEIEL